MTKLLTIIVFCNILSLSYCIQCFSCKGTGINELLANTNCLENGYLENCDDFYEYYSQVDDKKVLTDYYYEGEYLGYEDVNENKKAEKRVRRELKQVKGNEDSEVKNGTVKGEYEYYVYYVDEPSVENSGQDKSTNTSTKAGEKTKVKNEKSDDIIPSNSKVALAKDPEYACYSTTEKLDWENYAIEKGCKKITYCKSLETNKPEWGHPWNFCCDKSRCNAKIVKDKPQRIFGMECRRTDDCIQGHTSRPVCPYMYKSCPKIPPGVIKMECRAKGIDPTDIRHRYRNPFQEKKCYCMPGFFPRGPICTSQSANNRFSSIIFVLSFFTWKLKHIRFYS